ncbi:peptidylprolyl isomerase PrsA [Streptococcus intermedius]|uniref:peptidylprolyl isomerase PrsA n=1 Tax=Streptococcus intermedius TaxID=1338 RepID=UPI000E3DE5B2|nr:peptidylprolyl isomerase PrsA [Streptococcus intermedius]
MKKKFLAGAITLLSVVTLAACSQAGGKDIITMKGNTITVSDFYNKVKNNAAAQQVLLNMTIKNVFEKKYGKNVTEKEVTETFNKTKSSYGNAFAQALARAGLTEETYREQIKTNKLVEYAVKKEAEKSLTDANYKKAYESYTPEVTAQIIKVNNQNKAKELLAKAKAEGADFGKLAKENSTDTKTKNKGGEVKFDSTSTEVPTAVQKAAFALEANGISEVVTVKTSATSTSYYIVKVNSKKKKSDNWKDYKTQLKKMVLGQKQNDRTFIQKVVAKELQAANIKVKDQAFQNLFSQYVKSDNKSTSSSSSSSK